MCKKKLAIIISHSIQYYAPIFQRLAKSNIVSIKVFYTWSQAQNNIKDKEFGKVLQWDIPLLEGYDYTFVKNVSPNPGTNSFKGIQNPTLIQEIERWKADAVLVFGWSLSSHLKAIRYFHGRIPVLFRGDSHLLDERFGLKSLLRHTFLRWVYSHVDTALYVGKNNRDYFHKMGLLASQLVFAPHAIDNERFAGDEEKNYEHQASEWRRKLEISSQTIVILYAGKFIKKKQVVPLLENFIRFHNRNSDKDIKLVLVGNGDEEKKLLAMSKGRTDVKIMPFVNQSEMPIVYRIGDVFILPSKSETWGLAINEAMACSRPVITSNKVGCSVDLVDEGVTGWCFDYNKFEQLDTIFNNLDRYELKQTGSNALKKIQSWSFEKICCSIENEMLWNGKRVLAVFGNVLGPYGQELSNMKVFNLLLKSHYKVLALVNIEGFHFCLQQHFERREIPFEKIFFCWCGTALRRPWRLPWIIFQYIMGNIGVFYYCYRFKPDYIHINSDSYLFYLIPVLTIIRTKLIYRIGDAPNLMYCWRRWMWKYWVPKVITKVVCVSNFIADQVRQSSQNNINNVRVIYSYPARSIIKHESKDVFASKRKDILITYIGQITVQKGVGLFVDAALSICQKYSEVSFLIVGDKCNAFARELEKKISDANVGSRIQMIGYISDISAFFNQTDINVIPSIYGDPLPNVVIEAKCFGRPSIVFRDGGLPEMIAHKTDGYICKEKNSAALIQAMQYYIDAPDKIKIQGTNARKSIESLQLSRFDFERKWLQVYED